jgi:hypothetical protein
MRRILESVNGVSDVRRNWFNEDRFSFTFLGRACIVNEPFGDNSRYWIGPAEMEPPIDMTSVHREQPLSDQKAPFVHPWLPPTPSVQDPPRKGHAGSALILAAAALAVTEQSRVAPRTPPDQAPS